MKYLRNAFDCTFLLFLLSLLLCTHAYPLPAEKVESLDNREYFPKIHKILSDAKTSIKIIMFSSAYYNNISSSPTNVLIKDLIEAKKRNVDVEVILEKGDASKDSDLNSKNNIVKRMLEKENILVYNDSEKITTRCKLIIIDGYITIIGSTNWSYSAIAKNNETSVAIYSKEVAKHYLDYFGKIKIEQS